MTSVFGYIRTSRRLQDGGPGDVPRLPGVAAPESWRALANIHRDVGVPGTTGTQVRQGWHQLDGRLVGGDTLVVVAIDRIGWTWQDIVRSICELRDRGVKIRSLAEAEVQWPRYLEADEGSPEAFFGQVLVMFAAWVADQELQSVKRRTKEGLERAREQEKVLGPPRKFRPHHVEAMRRIRERGASLRRIAGAFECFGSTVLRVLRQEGVAAT